MDELDLHRMLDDVACRFEPQPDLARLNAELRRTSGRFSRSLTAWIGVAAGLALLAGSTQALTNTSRSDGVRPLGDRIEVVPEPSLPRTTNAPVPGPRSDDSTHPGIHPTPSTAPAATFEPPVVHSAPPLRNGTGSAPSAAALPVGDSPAPVTSVLAAPPTSAPEPPSTMEHVADAPPSEPQPTTTEHVADAPPSEPEPTVPATTTPSTTSSTPTTTAAPTTTMAPFVEVGFSAEQRWGSCELDPPYDEFWGTAPAGSTVNVESPYGSGQVTADDNGHWEITVYFPSAPVGVPFSVEVTASNGSASFTFTRT